MLFRLKLLLSICIASVEGRDGVTSALPIDLPPPELRNLEQISKVSHFLKHEQKLDYLNVALWMLQYVAKKARLNTGIWRVAEQSTFVTRSVGWFNTTLTSFGIVIAATIRPHHVPEGGCWRENAQQQLYQTTA